MEDALHANTLMLAFVGDAVYSLRVRLHVVQNCPPHGDRLHLGAARYVRASAQAKAINALFESLSEEEQRLVKRARNRKNSTKPKNADPIDYKWATAFEALLGYYCLSGQAGKLDAAVASAIRIIDGGEA
jgi:ribonuclease-3 family protein